MRVFFAFCSPLWELSITHPSDKRAMPAEDWIICHWGVIVRELFAAKNGGEKGGWCWWWWSSPFSVSEKTTHEERRFFWCGVVSTGAKASRPEVRRPFAYSGGTFSRLMSVNKRRGMHISRSIPPPPPSSLPSPPAHHARHLCGFWPFCHSCG